jgi:glycolate oxidase subunit GlcD
LVGEEAVLPGTERRYLSDATVSHGLVGRADAICLPADTRELSAVMRWCYLHEVPMVPRGGGTGLAGGAVPVSGGVVIALERFTKVRAFDPLLWRIHVDAGVTTATVRRLARESGLLFAPDPGAAENSQIGGNIATNAGGPHAFKYGVTGRWVTGLEVVTPDGDIVRIGGPLRKDVAGYDLKSLFVGSEGTLGVISAAWLSLIPAPEAAYPVVATYETVQKGCDALESVLGHGIAAAALEFLDEGAIAAAAPTFPGPVQGGRFMLICEADGSEAEARRVRGEIVAVLGNEATHIHAPATRDAIDRLWQWRDGVSLAVTARRGGKMSEDVVVPIELLGRFVEEIVQVGRRHDLDACSWGHGGDGNVHATFLLRPGDDGELERATAAADEVLALAAGLGGSITGEHGMGWVKRGRLAAQWSGPAVAIHRQIKAALDSKGLMNPGKKQ